MESEEQGITLPDDINRIAAEIQPGPGSGEDPIDATITIELFQSASLLAFISHQWLIIWKNLELTGDNYPQKLVRFCRKGES